MNDSEFSHVLNNQHQQILYYTLSTAADQEFKRYRQWLYGILGGLLFLLCYAVYYWYFHQWLLIPEANPDLVIREAQVLHSLKEKMDILRKESWETPPDGKNLPATILVKGSSGYLPPSMARLEHDHSQRKEHRKQRRVSFAADV